ncbi:hypothetical protein SAMN04487968_112122 [Nocardioides terrae]|uniref:WXG100 family type VII secretion target n=1 Tax=Nocardioides terrae TaxID=574651 RepID=A0A1I1MIL5_9ACTN|nr:hypothetical protein [Nocardioides terrae]SFC85269.1 hypothetical protein SAMN04487968_112122 [Nocardioides terrae]
MADAFLTYSSLDAAAADIMTVKDDLLTLLGEVQTAVDGLGSDFHTQVASNTYEHTVTEFVTSTTKALNGLHGVAQILTATVDTFGQADAALAKGISG